MYEDSDAICPFFKRMYKAKGKSFINKISCEGLIDGTSIETTFTHNGQAEKYKCLYCDKHYFKACPVYKAVANKCK